ncbi:MAG: hypothetical protein AAGJ94_00185 [Pseudomonadota bacterium]
MTGTPRSGTTVVGNALALAAHTKALYEPMNRDSGDKIIRRYFEVPDENGFSTADCDGLIDRVAGLSLQLRSGAFDHEKGLRRLAKLMIGGQSRHSLRMARLALDVRHVIWKDPFAPFVARRAVEEFGIPVVITVRPPLAVAASFKRLNWRFDVAELDRSLHGKYLANRPLSDPANIIERSAALWQMVYGELSELHARHPNDVRIVMMDGLIDTAQDTFAALYADLGLEASTQARAAIAKMFQPTNAAKAAVPAGHPHSRNRDIRTANTYWSKLLDESEVEAVRTRTADVEAYFDRSGGVTVNA